MSKLEVNESTFIGLVEDVKEIKAVLKGDEYHPEGMVHQVKKNTDCINKVKRDQAKREGIVGVIILFLAGAVTTIINLILGK